MFSIHNTAKKFDNATITSHFGSGKLHDYLIVTFSREEERGPSARRVAPLYGLYMYVRPQRVWYFSRFSHKLGIDFCTLVFNSVFL